MECSPRTHGRSVFTSVMRREEEMESIEARHALGVKSREALHLSRQVELAVNRVQRHLSRQDHVTWHDVAEFSIVVYSLSDALLILRGFGAALTPDEEQPECSRTFDERAECHLCDA